MKGIIFDMDGTMFDSETIWQDMWYHLPLEYGYGVDETLGKDMSGTGGILSQRVAKEHFPSLDPEEFVKHGRQVFHDRIMAHQPNDMPGIREAVNFFHTKGYKLAVASGSDIDLIRLNLQRSELAEYFDATVSENSVAYSKPHPDIFLKAASEIGLDSKDCFVIEDSENGVRAGVAAGCKTIMIPDKIMPSEEVKSICFGVYKSLLELIDTDIF